ncbi:hypothetical protein FRB97_000122 [Tulasnella sp. 331]|nr:hypothetical protein FRB97_000122 [Tulasnella sp. 331]
MVNSNASHEAGSWIRQNNGRWSVEDQSGCHVAASNDHVASRIWFKTPGLNFCAASQLSHLQLTTIGRNQGWVADQSGDIWSWMEVIILDSPASSKPRVVNGRSLAFVSHFVTSRDLERQVGKRFTPENEPDMFRWLKAGNSIAARVCAQYRGWECHGATGLLDTQIIIGADLPRVLQAQNVALRNATANFLEQARVGGRAQTPRSEAVELLDSGTLGVNVQEWEDGGGVCGLTSLYVLRDIMAKIPGGRGSKPWQHFDIMAGTSTGGLIAIMLGRLRMSISDCIDAYKELSRRIFDISTIDKTNNFVRTGAQYSAETLQQAFKFIIKEYSGSMNPEEPMLEEHAPENDCKVFVVACHTENLNQEVALHLRTYKHRRVTAIPNSWKIWEAARATSAAPTYFPPMEVGDRSYTDGGVGFNNPILLVIVEARNVYGPTRPIGCIISLGTGMTSNISLPRPSRNPFKNAVRILGTARAISRTVAASEHAHHLAEAQFTEQFPHFDPMEIGAYYRFNPGRRTADGSDWEPAIDLDDHKGMQQLEIMAEGYLLTERTRLRECAEKLFKSETL